MTAAWHSLLGARIAQKCTFGKSVRIDQPQCLTVGERATLEDLVWMKIVSESAMVEVGAHTFIGRGCEFDVSKQLTIGHHVLFGPNVFITDHNHNFAIGGPIMNQGCTASPVTIGDDVWIGTGVVILPGVSIGHGAVVGAGSVVTQDLRANTIYAGIPAKKIRARN